MGPTALGLQPADDIDAFTVFDDGDHVFTPGIDQVVFSLTPDSPSLGGSYSPADLFTSEGNGVFDVYTEAFDLGLAFADNLNMLDFALCDDVLGCARLGHRLRRARRASAKTARAGRHSRGGGTLTHPERGSGAQRADGVV